MENQIHIDTKGNRSKMITVGIFIHGSVARGHHSLKPDWLMSTIEPLDFNCVNEQLVRPIAPFRKIHNSTPMLCIHFSWWYNILHTLGWA